MNKQIYDPFGEETTDDKPKIIPNEPGICKNCGSFNLEYGRLIGTGIQIAWEYDCEDCHFCGLEVYNIDFLCHEER